MHSVSASQTDGQTDGRQDYANSRAYCVAVGWAKMNEADCKTGQLTFPAEVVATSAVGVWLVVSDAEELRWAAAA